MGAWNDNSCDLTRASICELDFNKVVKNLTMNSEMQAWVKSQVEHRTFAKLDMFQRNQDLADQVANLTEKSHELLNHNQRNLVSALKECNLEMDKLAEDMIEIYPAMENATTEVQKLVSENEELQKELEMMTYQSNNCTAAREDRLLAEIDMLYGNNTELKKQMENQFEKFSLELNKTKSQNSSTKKCTFQTCMSMIFSYN